MTLDKEETALVEFGRNIENWKTLNVHCAENTTHEQVFVNIDDTYQSREDDIGIAIENEEEVFGTDCNDQTYQIFPPINRKTPGTRPIF
jgi:hypothetical protein